MKTVILFLSIMLQALAYTGEQVATENQPVFLFCPNENHSAISLFVVVDKNNPQTILSLGLEELDGKNCKKDTYNGVLKSCDDPNTSRTQLSTLNAKDFDTSLLKVEKNDMLSIKVGKIDDTSLKLTIDARVSHDGHFLVGDNSDRNVFLSYDTLTKRWKIIPKKLVATNGQDCAGNCSCLTGICFRAGSTTIDRICAVDVSGRFFVLMDR